MSGIEIAERMFMIHDHPGNLLRGDLDGEDEDYLRNPDIIVYREEDVIQLLKDLGHPEPDWDGYAKQCEELEKK